MATNGQIGFSDKMPNPAKVTLKWSVASQSIADNTTTISWTLELYGGSGIAAVNDRWYYVVINGEEFKGTDNITAAAGTTKTLASGTAIIPHNTDGTKSFECYMEHQWDTISDSRAYYWASGVGTLPDIPRAFSITNEPNFNDEGNPVIEYNNTELPLLYSKLQAAISLDGTTADIAYRDITINGGSYTFALTSNERKLLRQNTTKNSRVVTFLLKTIFGDGVTLYTSKDAQLTLINYLPTLSPTIVDTNSTTTALTGNNSRFIQYFSNAQFTANATARKEATVREVSVINGDNSFTSATGTVSGISNKTFHFNVVDSRGYVADVSRDVTLIQYTKLTGALSALPITATGELSFTIKGKYFNSTFGATNNTLTVNYVLRKNGQQVGAANAISGTLTTDSASGYQYTYTITGLEPTEIDGTSNDYTLAVTIKDKLMTVPLNEVTVSYMPIFDWGKRDFNFNVPVHFSRGFTNDVGLKTYSESIVLDLSTAGAHSFIRLIDKGLTHNNTIYSITGTIAPESSGRVYPLPIPALTLGVGDTPRYSIEEAARLWINEELEVCLTTGAPWGIARINVVIMYF